MLQLHPEFLRKDGKEQFVVLPYEEFVALQELLDDARDLIELEAARATEKDAPSMSLEDVAKKFGIKLQR